MSDTVSLGICFAVQDARPALFARGDNYVRDNTLLTDMLCVEPKDIGKNWGRCLLKFSSPIAWFKGHLYVLRQEGINKTIRVLSGKNTFGFYGRNARFRCDISDKLGIHTIDKTLSYVFFGDQKNVLLLNLLRRNATSPFTTPVVLELTRAQTIPTLEIFLFMGSRNHRLRRVFFDELPCFILSTRSNRPCALITFNKLGVPQPVTAGIRDVSVIRKNLF